MKHKTIIILLLALLFPSVSAAAGPNLILNPSLETAGPNGPQDWFTNSWGTNTQTFSYPEPGRNGGTAAKVEIQSYASGDSKWYFKDVKVSGGQEYQFSDYYKSNVKSNITARFLLANGSYLYKWQGDPAPATDWTLHQVNISVPADAVSMTVFHLIKSKGYLAVDDFSLNLLGDEPGDEPGPTGGLVSLTFDDGWLSHYTNAKPILDGKNLKGTFYIVSQTTIDSVPYNQIYNSDLKINNNGTPGGWGTNSWGVNKAVFSYPVAGRNDNFAAKVDVTEYTSGDAKWWFNDIGVTAGQEYTFSDYYKSNVKSYITFRYTMNDNSFQYRGISQLAASSDWKRFNHVFTVPAGVKSMTVYHLLMEKGSLTVDDYSLTSGARSIMIPSEVIGMQAAGHEIGAHSRTHPYLTSLSTAQAKLEIEGSKSDLLGLGASPVSTFAYPYGAFNDNVKQLTIGAGYTSARGVERGFNTKSTDKHALKIQQVDHMTTFNDVKNWIDTANKDNTWLILMFHQIDHTGAYYGTTPEILKAITDYLSSSKTKTVTVSEGTALMN